MGHLTALKDLRQKGFVIPGSDGTVNLGAYSEAAEKLWRKARAGSGAEIAALRGSEGSFIGPSWTSWGRLGGPSPALRGRPRPLVAPLEAAPGASQRRTFRGI